MPIRKMARPKMASAIKTRRCASQTICAVCVKSWKLLRASILTWLSRHRLQTAAAAYGIAAKLRIPQPRMPLSSKMNNSQFRRNRKDHEALICIIEDGSQAATKDGDK